MTQEKLYYILNKIKWKLSKQQYMAIKGQINTNDLVGAYKGIQKLVKEKIC
jgi:hypothetical protein